MKKICKRCYGAALAAENLGDVKKLLKNRDYMCPWFDRKCGNTAEMLDRKPTDSLSGLAKIIDVFFNGRSA